MYRILVTDALGVTYAKEPSGELATFDHILEAEAFADVWYVGKPGVRAIALVREAWPLRAEQMRRDLAAGLPLQRVG